jgi:pyridoxine 5-phosphate synthase
MTKLSVNINKIATIRNARGGNMPDVEKAAVDCQLFGAEGITVHPRPDERHIRYSDVREIKPLITTEFNIEGNPIPKFIDLVLEVVPTQVTLVPDAENAITSNAGWDTISHKGFLKDVCKEFKAKGIRTSIFVDPDPRMVEGAAACGCDRVELYTADYAAEYAAGPKKAISRFVEARRRSSQMRFGTQCRSRPQH